MKGRGRVLGFLLIVVTVLGLSFFGHLFLFEQWRVQHERQLQRASIREEILRLKHLSVEVETSFRGYLLAEQRSFLEPLQLAEERLNASVAELNRQAQDAPSLKPGVQVLSARLKEFIDSKKQLATVADTGHRDQVHVYVRVGDGRALFLTIEKAFRDLEGRVDREFPAERLDYETWIRQARWQLLLLEGAAVLVSLYASRFLATPRYAGENSRPDPPRAFLQPESRRAAGSEPVS